MIIGCNKTLRELKQNIEKITSTEDKKRFEEYKSGKAKVVSEDEAVRILSQNSLGDTED